MLKPAQKFLADSRLQPGKVSKMHDFDIKSIWLTAIAFGGIAGDERAQILFLVGLDEELACHEISPLSRTRNLLTSRLYRLPGMIVILLLTGN